jgi:uncharacterized membrane protein required for colicin V production
LNWLDGVIIALIVIGALMGYRIGVLRGLFLAVGVLVGFILAAQASEPLADLLTNSVKSDSLATVIAYGIIAAIVLIVTQMAARFVGGVMRFLFLGPLDSLGGAFLGAFAALVIGGATIAILARLAFLVPDLPVENLGPVSVREKISDTLIGSNMAELYIDIQDALPASALGMIPGDFHAVFEVLDQQIFLHRNEE